MAKPTTPKGIYNLLKKKYFAPLFPETVWPQWHEITFRWVIQGGEGEFMDARHDLGTVMETKEGWVIEIIEGIRDFPVLIEFILAHEMLHMTAGPEHGSKAWNAGYRKLVGANFFWRIF